MTKDIKALISIYTILILIGWNIVLSHKVEKEQKEKIEVMKVALKNDALNKEYISILQQSREELNNELDLLADNLKDKNDLNNLLKDLR